MGSVFVVEKKGVAAPYAPFKVFLTADEAVNCVGEYGLPCGFLRVVEYATRESLTDGEQAAVAIAFFFCWFVGWGMAFAFLR